MGARQSLNRIDEEWKQIDTLLLSAKKGRWEAVWEILGSPGAPNKLYLVNCIPESRRWGVLHQAVYWNNPTVLRRLLEYKECDREMRAKVCMSECGETGKLTPREVADKFGYTEMSRVLQESPVISLVDESTTFAPYDTVIERQGRGLVAITLSAFKNTFHPGPIDKSKNVDEILKDIYQSLNTSQNQWTNVRDQVCDALYVVNEVSSNVIKGESTNRGKFYMSIIRAYTREPFCLFDFVNTVLRRQTESDYTPLATDLAAGPYIVMLKLLLLYWDRLPRETATTYRNMLLTVEQLKAYRVGTRFTWLAFVSSSVVEEMAMRFPTVESKGKCSVLFTIDNQLSSPWQPRNIDSFSFSKEHERVYPPRVKFEVMKRLEGSVRTCIKLKLIA